MIVGTVPGAPIERSAAPEPAPGPDVNTADKAGNKNGAKGPDGQAKDKSAGAQNDPKKDEPKPMVVPPDAKQKQDLAFLKGDWRSRTGLATASGEKDLRPSYTLDDKGKGKVSFVQKTVPPARPPPRRAGTTASW